ncbi:MAG: Crp/Fnr family transcriptional regulator [Deltaproteobacteria bacterium]|nr:Crp/Fnr family transcriptional regulator [Deltaproteobacteria bacterium]
MTLAETIAAIPLFEGLSPEQSQALAAIARQSSFQKGERIFSEGDEGRGLHVVASGKVRVFKLSPAGKEQILHIFGPGDPFGEIALFSGRSFPAHAEAHDDCEVLFFPRREFAACIAADPSLAFNMLAVLSQRLRRFAQLIEDLSLKEVPGRLAAHLLFLSRRDGGRDRVTLEVTKGQLASLLGTIPETLSRILARMSRQGLIEVDGARIVLRQIEVLRALAEGEERLD